MTTPDLPRWASVPDAHDYLVDGRRLDVTGRLFA